jgi:hypothetical protein
MRVLRYEHVTSAYYSFGIKEEAPEQKLMMIGFPNVFPRMEQKTYGVWQLSYTKKTPPALLIQASEAMCSMMEGFTYEAGKPLSDACHQAQH